MSEQTAMAARMATIDVLLEPGGMVENFLKPVPKRETFRNWLDGNKIPRFKSNPTAKRGGGTVWYSVAGVEKLLRNRLTTS